MSTIATNSGPISWNVDSSHSSVDFSVKHMGVFTVKGSLGTTTGTAQTADGVLESLSLSIDVSAISTNNEQRDGHLKSADFLNVEANPTIEFKSTTIVKKSDAEYSVTGDLLLAGTSKPLTVEVEVVPPVKDPWGNTRSGATGSGVLSRKEWGLSYNSVMDTGHVLISDDVKFSFDIQAVTA